MSEAIINWFKNKYKGPFAGAFLITWVLYNWEVFYVTFFLDNKEIKTNSINNKLEFIKHHFDGAWKPSLEISEIGSVWKILFYTFCLMLIVPLFSKIAYRLKSWHDEYQSKMKLHHEKRIKISDIKVSEKIKEEISHAQNNSIKNNYLNRIEKLEIERNEANREKDEFKAKFEALKNIAKNMTKNS